MIDTTRELLQVLLSSVKKHLGDEINYELNLDSLMNLSIDDIEFISSIDIHGKINGDLYLFMTKSALKVILNNVFNTQYEVLENDGLLHDCVNELLNMIIANSTEKLARANLEVDIGVPLERINEAFIDFVKKMNNYLKVSIRDDFFYIVFVPAIDNSEKGE